MAAEYRMLLTITGKAAVAAFAAGGDPVEISHFAIGDANNAPYNPNENQVALVHEVYRTPIASITAIEGGIVEVRATIPADTPDEQGRPSNGWQVHELGVIDAAGRLIGVARMNGGFKPSPASGQAASADLQVKLAVGDTSAITLVIDPATNVGLGKMLRPAFLVVDGITDAPPANPVAGATVVVGANPTGSFAGGAHKLAQWEGDAWHLRDVDVGFIVTDKTKPPSDPDHQIRRTATGWVPNKAGIDAHGLIKIAPDPFDDEDDENAVTPQQAAALLEATTPGAPTTGQVAGPGDVKWTAATTLPSGWLRCNGAAISRAAYPELFTAIGTAFGAGDGETTFNLPDSRGRFLRDLDDGAGRDSGRTLGSVQADAALSHTHAATFTAGHYLVGPKGSGYQNLILSTGIAEDSATNYALRPSGVSAAAQSGGAAETRPVNLALQLVIKY